MNVIVNLPSVDAQGNVYLTWTPIEGSLQLQNAPAGISAVTVTLQNGGTGGQLAFDDHLSDDGTATLNVSLPGNGSPMSFWVAGEFLNPSSNLNDAQIDVVETATTSVLGSLRATVRIRKNANDMTSGERDRFLTAFSILNGSGAGRFSSFRDMHRNSTSNEAHGNFGFLPWHRAYLLDLERELQAVDSSVSLPYWRFDQAASNVFNRRFMGVPNAIGRVQFSAGHPLSTWRTDNQLGITRPMSFQPGNAPTNIRSEAQTLTLGLPGDIYSLFINSMERNPHGRAHTRFGGPISAIDTAARDPLFFMLHANVDRLWAKWQWLKQRMDPADSSTFQDVANNRIGHRLNDTMWPWNQVTSPPRPATAPGGGLAPSPVTNAPGSTPTVGSMIDYQGVSGAEPLDFAYDDVPFEL